MKHAEIYLLDPATRLLRAERQPRDIGSCQFVFQDLEARCFSLRRAGPEFAGSELIDDRAHAAVMIDARVTDEEVVDFDYFPRAQKRRNDGLTRIEITDSRAAAVDQQKLTAWQLDHCGVALTNIEVSDPQLIPPVPFAPPVHPISAKNCDGNAHCQQHLPFPSEQENANDQ